MTPQEKAQAALKAAEIKQKIAQTKAGYGAAAPPTTQNKAQSAVKAAKIKQQVSTTKAGYKSDDGALGSPPQQIEHKTASNVFTLPKKNDGNVKAMPTIPDTTMTGMQDAANSGKSEVDIAQEALDKTLGKITDLPPYGTPSPEHISELEDKAGVNEYNTQLKNISS